MRKIYITIILAAFTVPALSQLDSVKQIGEVVITGQYKPQSIKNSVYQVRVINNERIRLSGATTIAQVLNNQLGFRFSNDNTLGTTDVQLMGMSGRNVKILLDGVPLLDRGDTRESLNQVDINTVDRIEIVEGPMSVSYGSDALAGVINIITKKTIQSQFSVFARAQEETAGTEYYPFSYKGVHTQTIRVSSSVNHWLLEAGGTHNDADGFGGDSYGRAKTWRPKEQWMGNVKFGYSNSIYTIYYRLDGLNESITNRGAINLANYEARDQKYVTDRYMHQVQGEYRLNEKLNLSGILAYTDYQRRTRTTIHDFQKNTDALTVNDGEQDVSKFNSFLFRANLLYKASPIFSLQPGIDINREEASGARISGKPVITDYALFVSSEIKPTNKISIRPGLRFIKNSVYDAPPVIPSINTKFILSESMDLRLAYAYGFRSPALRELYFYFHDANHDIDGNPDLKAEHSNSFTGSLTWSAERKFSTTLSGFYNDFNNQIDLVLSAGSNPPLYTYFNVNHSKTTGGTLENKLFVKDLEATLGFSYIGYYSSLYDDPSYIKEDNRDFLWTPEINSNIIYSANKLKTKFSLFYKYTGRKPAFAHGTDTSGQPITYVARTSSFNLADFTVTTTINKYLVANGGVKNIFNVTDVTNTAVNTGVHNSDGPLAVSYGRSYFLGLSFQWNKK
jgi:outer membrane receptor for ferrienterochelin and colicins